MSLARDRSMLHVVSLGASTLLAIAVAGWAAWIVTLLRVPEPSLVWWIALPTAIAASIGFLSARWIVRRALEPLDSLTSSISEAAFQPRDQISYLTSRLQARTGAMADELRALAKVLEQLLGKIERRHAMQTAWIGAIVHDLKTPLVACANTLDVIAAQAAEESTRTGSETASLAKRLARELRTLVGDVQKMIDVVRFEREDITIERTVVDLAALAGSVITAVSSRQGLALFVRGSGTALADEALLQRALENLVSNAVRYARSTVIIEVYPGLFRVKDDGPGLPAPLEFLSQPFRSEPLDVGGVNVAGGAAGIGLFLARRVLELHGGKLVLEGTSAQGTAILGYIEAKRGA